MNECLARLLATATAGLIVACTGEVGDFGAPAVGGDPFRDEGDPFRHDLSDSDDVLDGDDSSNAECFEDWQGTDIGSVGIPGSFRCNDDGEFVVNASGTDVWGSRDELHYVYQRLSGDGWIVARVVSSNAEAAWSKAGVMIRESLASDSRHAHVLVLNGPENPVKLDWRTDTGGTTSGVTGSRVGAPYWVMLVPR